MLREHERAAAVTDSSGGGGGVDGSNDGVAAGMEDDAADYPGGITPEDLATTIATLHAFGHSTDLLKMKEFKALRGALHPASAMTTLSARLVRRTCPFPPSPLRFPPNSLPFFPVSPVSAILQSIIAA